LVIVDLRLMIGRKRSREVRKKKSEF